MLDFSANLGIAVREYQTDVGPTDYVLFVESKPSVLSRPSRRNGVTISRPLNRSPALMPLPNSNGSTTRNPCRSYTNLPVGLRGLPMDATRNPAPGRFSTSCDRKPCRGGTQMTTRFVPGFGLPQFSGGSVPGLPVSRPARRSLAFRPACLLNCSQRPFDTRGLQTISLPP